jgi:TonB-linked SusC/RagA family outer membrane protein
MKRLFTTLLLVLAIAGISMAQRTVTGKVSGDDGEALIGATLAVKGTSGGTRTDVAGKYSIQIPAGATTLVVSYTGYTTQEIALGASNTIDVVLTAGVQLAETVVTALGISRSEKSVGYGISKVDGSAITGSGETNAIEGLAAKVSGVQVVSSSGTPGASAKILIRGNSSLQLGNQPLLVIDNVPYDNNVNTVVGGDYPFNANLGGVNESNRGIDINPDDIENISILKGPTASALYGTRAANGVIMITTKKGKKGSLQASYGFSYDISEVNKLPDLQTSYGQGSGGGLVVKDAGGIVTGSTTNGTSTNATPNSWGPEIKAGEGNDNLATFFKKGMNATHNFSIGGGNDNSSFRFTYSNTSQSGIIPHTSLDRNTFRVNASTGTEKFKVNVSGAYTASHDFKAQNGSNLSGVMLPLLRMPADFKVLGGTGPNGYDERDGSQHQFFSAYDNPAWTAAHNPNSSNVGRFTGSLGMDYLPLDWLTLTFRIGTDVYNDERRQIFDIGNNSNDPGGELWQANVKHEEVNTDFFGRIHKVFGDFSTNLVVGSQLNHRYDQNVFARGQEFAVPNYFNLNNASILYADNSSATRRLAGVYGSLDIGYKDMLYLTVGGRNDWASTFGPKAKNSFFYPNAALSFIPTEIMAKNDLLTYLKLRVSYAQAGREPNPYTSKTYYNRPTFTDGFTNGLSFPYLGANGFAISSVLGNTTLRPEINTSYETGVDLRLWKNRATLNVTYYHSKSTDLLVTRPIASSSGFGYFVSNAGSMQNQGIEIEANVDIVKTKGFNWTLGGNFTKNVNKVLALAPGVDQFSIESAFTGIGSYAIAGQPYGAIFGTQWARNSSGQLIIGSNGLPTRNAAEGFLGNPYPDWTAGIRNVFSFKGLSLSGLLDIRHGGQLWNGTYARLNRIGRTEESAAGRANYYIIPGVKADGSANDIRIGSNAYFATFKGDGGAYAVENAIQDGGWVRLREVTLSYTLPKFTKYIKDITIYVTGRNLWLKTDYKGVDPETSLTGAGSNIGGFDYFNMPGTKSYIFGLRSNF